MSKETSRLTEASQEVQNRIIKIMQDLEKKSEGELPFGQVKK